MPITPTRPAESRPVAATQPPGPARSGRLRACCCALWLACVPGLATAAAIDPLQPIQPRDSFAEALRLWVDTVVASGAAPAVAVAVVRPGQSDLLVAAGETEAGSGEAVDGRTVFRLASVSKGFASTLCVMLADAGYVALDQTVVDWVPGLRLADPGAPAQLTIERLLSHQTGLPRHTLDMKLEANARLADLVNELPTVRPSCRVGECYAYQNVLFNMAADVAFSAAGSFFQVELRKRLLLPLDMSDTSVGREELFAAARWARPHVNTRRGWIAVEPKPTYYQLPAAAGVNGSARDLARWMRAQMGARPDVLPAHLLKALQTPRIETPGESMGSRWRRERLENPSYALGWRVFDYAGEPMVFHAGAVQGYRAMVGMLPEQGIGVALLWNSNSGVPAGIFPRSLDTLLELEGPDWLDLDQLQVAARR